MIIIIDITGSEALTTCVKLTAPAPRAMTPLAWVRDWYVATGARKEQVSVKKRLLGFGGK